MESYSLAHALRLWRKSKAAKNIGESFEKNLSIALRKYVIPALDTSNAQLSTKAFTNYCTQFPVNKLHNCLTIFDQQTQSAIGTGQLSTHTKSNYRSALRRFLSWLEQQVWWQEVFSKPPTDDDVAPFRIYPEFKKPTAKCPENYKYSFDKSKLSKELIEQFQAYKKFRMTAGKSAQQRRQNRQAGRVRRPKIKAVKLSTYRKEEYIILSFFGWYTQTYPGALLDLSLLTDLSLLDDYVLWVTEVRGSSYAQAEHTAGTAIAIAKWLNYDKSVRRNWSDVLVVMELQDLRNGYSEIYKQEKRRNATKKWKYKKLMHEEARQVVQYLQLLCAPNYGKHNKETGEFLSHGRRPNSAVARAWQTYLIVKILVYCPIRQEELRNYVLGETLFRKEDEQGKPYYVAKLSEHKRSQITGQRYYRLPAILTEDLDLWLLKWRPLIVDAVKYLDTWMEFWGYSLERIERMRKRVEAARQGIVSDKVTASMEKYLEQEETRLRGAENRVAAWELAKSNLEAHNYAFFMFAKGEPQSFGKPHNVTSIWSMVSESIANATQALFDEPRWTNPHALRHVAEKHIRQIGKQKIAHAFGTLIGHSKEMGDEYAKQITSEYEQSLAIVDNWWKPTVDEGN